MRKAAGTIKRVTLELGGKSAAIVFADADLEKVGRQAPFAVFENCGQDCCARSRLLVEESVKDEVLERYAATTHAIVVGDPEDADTQVGPMVSAGQRDTVERYIERGVGEGATARRGRRAPVRPRARGRLLPAARRSSTACTNDMAVSREEIFGPVVSVITFRDEDEAIRLANDTPYGLSGSLWTRDGARQLRVARAMRTGCIGVNSQLVGVPAGAVRRLQAVGHRQGARDGRPRAQHRAEERLHLDRALIASQTPGVGRRPSASAGAITAANRASRDPWARATASTSSGRSPGVRVPLV